MSVLMIRLWEHPSTSSSRATVAFGRRVYASNLASSPTTLIFSYGEGTKAWVQSGDYWVPTLHVTLGRASIYFLIRAEVRFSDKEQPSSLNLTACWRKMLQCTFLYYMKRISKYTIPFPVGCSNVSGTYKSGCITCNIVPLFGIPEALFWDQGINMVVSCYVEMSTLTSTPQVYFLGDCHLLLCYSTRAMYNLGMLLGPPTQWDWES